VEQITEKQTWEHLLGLDSKLENATELYKEAVADCYAKKVRFKLEMARQRKLASGSVQAREDEALLACEGLFSEFMVAEAKVDGLGQVVRSLRERCNNGRSLNASVRGQTNDGSF